MARVEVSRSGQQDVELPAVCVKTGTPTTDLVRLSGSAAPAWTGAMILLGIVAWLFTSWMASRRYDVVVPLKAAVLERHRAWRRASWVLVGVGLTMTLVAAVLGRPNAFILLMVLVAGMAFHLVNEWINAVGVQLAGDGALVLTRVHPDFARAVLDQGRTVGDRR